MNSSVRAIVLLAVLAILVVMATTAIILWDLRRNELDRATAERDAIADLFVKQMRHDLNSISLDLKVVLERMQSSYGARLALDSPEVFLLLSARAAASEPTSSMFIADTAGTVVNTSLAYPPNRINIADRDYFKIFVDNEVDDFFISHPVRNRVDNKWTMYFSRPMKWEDGRRRGILVAAVPPRRFEDLFETLRLGVKREMSLHLMDGTLVASQPRREELLETAQQKTVANALERRSMNRVTLREIKGYPLYVKVGTDEDTALTQWREAAVPIASGSVLICLSIIGIAVWLANKLAREQLLKQALSAADERHSHTVASVMDAIVAVDERHNIILFNPAAERMFGLSETEATGQPIYLLIPAQLHERYRQYVEAILGAADSADMLAPRLEIFGQRANGEQFPIESSLSRMEFNGKVQMTAVFRDITERRQAEARLRDANQQLRTLSSALQEVREEERTFLSRELHDELGQQLTGLKLDLTWLAARIREKRPAEPERLTAMRQLLDNIIASVRRISSDLRPPVLDDLGFCEAVRWLKEETEKRSGLVIDIDLPDVQLVACDHLATSMYRIVQEALTNIVRHAEASHVFIQLAENARGFVLTIRDNGKGGSIDAHNEGIGLVSMRERVTSLDGEFSIIGEPGQGFTIKASFPFQLSNPGNNMQ